jgi:hypothetical protein
LAERSQEISPATPGAQPFPSPDQRYPSWRSGMGATYAMNESMYE